MTRISLRYSGRVQGVGFRYTTHRLAQRFAVSGYVLNLPDGRVELVVEAEPKEAHAFLAAVDESLGRYITDTNKRTATPTGEFCDFSIRH